MIKIQSNLFFYFNNIFLLFYIIYQIKINLENFLKDNKSLYYYKIKLQQYF